LLGKGALPEHGQNVCVVNAKGLVRRVFGMRVTVSSVKIHFVDRFAESWAIFR